MRLTSLMGFLADDLAVDLGTANTLVYVRGHGIVLNEPSIVAMKDGTVLAAGHEAKAMLGRAPGSISVVRPLRHGVIADFDSTEKMLHYFIAKTRQRKTLAHPRVVVTVPSGITQVEKRAVRQSARQAGAREAFLIEEPIAAALGAGLPVADPGANMIVDIGGGTTEVAVISLSGIVYSKSVRIAGDEMDEAIVQYIKKHYNLLVGDHQRLRHALDEVAALDLEPQLVLERERRAELPLDLLRRALADQQVVLALEVLHDGIVHLVAGHADGARVDDTGE